MEPGTSYAFTVELALMEPGTSYYRSYRLTVEQMIMKPTNCLIMAEFCPTKNVSLSGTLREGQLGSTTKMIMVRYQ
jgi:hypothetical protein